MDVENYLSNFFKGTKNPSLKAMKFFMDEFEHPEEKLKCIHIAGTNGKGSVAEMLTNVLIKKEYTVGKFISPHLIKYNERISVDNINISDSEMEKLINKIDPLIQKYNSQNDVPITLFELETTMAFLYFKEKQCDFVILETGLGGLYDCTNIISNPLVSIITSIGYDHMHILGNTLPEIAYQKAGIIKENSNTVIFNQDPDVDNVFITECKNKNNTLHNLDELDIHNYSYDENYQYFDFKNYNKVTINLKGKAQVKNACLCLETFNILNDLGYTIGLKNIQDGLKKVIHKARFEQINDKPLMIYDGAHNEPAIKNFMETVKMYYSKRKRIYIISILKSKDYRSILELLSEDKEAFFVLTSGDDQGRFTASDELYKCMRQFLSNDKLSQKSLEEAILDAKKNDSETVTFFVGSFYAYKKAINIIKSNLNDKVV